LRDIIGVLRGTDNPQAEHPEAQAPGAEPPEAPYDPQPRLGDIAHLVGGYQRAGLDVELDMGVDEPDAAPGPLGRDAYRIVREALTNVTKHASGAAATVSLSGCPGEGLRVVVRNKLPARAGPAAAKLPGSGLGLVSLAERVALAGGTLAHGPDVSGDFVLTATLRWED
jgi:signal transduction histidine kinase